MKSENSESSSNLEPIVRKAVNGNRGALEEEVKIGCMRGMLLCLDRKYRLAYVLGEVFEVKSEDAGKLLDISPETYRKRLFRARRRIRNFMKANCGLIDKEASCRCHKQIKSGIKKGRVDPDHLLFAAPKQLRDDGMIKSRVSEMEELHEVAAVYRSQPTNKAPNAILDKIRQILDSESYQILN